MAKSYHAKIVPFCVKNYLESSWILVAFKQKHTWSPTPIFQASSFGTIQVGSNRNTTRISSRDKFIVNMVVTTHINKAFMSFQASSKILWNSECQACKQPFKSYSYTQDDQNWLTQKTLSDSMVISGWTISIAHLGKVTQLQVPILDSNDPYQIG